MTSTNYISVAKTHDIPLKKTLCVNVADREILICHSVEGYYAVDNLCTHADAKLSEGKLKGCKILCPLHGAAFDIKDGSALTRPASKPLRSYPLQVINEDIQIAVE